MTRLVILFFLLFAALTEGSLPNKVKIAGSVRSYGYSFDKWGQRTNIARLFNGGRSSLALGYDFAGQLTSATGRETNGTARLHEKFGYEYSGANNVAARTNNALVQTFASDGANQLTNLSRAGTLTVAGLLTRPATNLSVNGVTNGSLYADRTWASSGHTLLNNVTNTFSVTALDPSGTPAQGTMSIYGAPSVTLTYDPNGNLTNDQRRIFEYDADNQLTNVYEPGGWRSEFRYDGLNRRRVRREYTWSAGAWTLTNEVRYLYDGLLVLQERDSNNIPLLTYTRGLDLSGSLQGAGGIGGLLALSDQRADASNPTNYFYHADGNGNIVALLNKKSEVVARYLYDPFGNLIAKSGPIADFNRYRFSSKEVHPNSGLHYYGHRYYEPYLQRWLTQDPMEEAGGMNLYQFVGNKPMSRIDPFGLKYGNPVPQVVYQDRSTGRIEVGRESIFSHPSPDAPEVAATIGGIFLEPLDWAMTAGEIYEDPSSPMSYAGLIPFVPAAAGKLGKKVCRVTGDALATLRKEFNAMKPKAWMDEAARNPNKYSPEQLAKMRKGEAPLGSDGYSMEIHHKQPLAEGGANKFDNFEFKSRSDHRLGDNYKKNHPNLP